MNKILIIALGLSVLAAVGAGKLWIDTKAELAVATAQLQTYEKAMKEFSASQNKFETDSAKLQQEAREAKAELEKYKGRYNVLLAKPSLIEKKAKAATLKVQEELACETGATEYCH